VHLPVCVVDQELSSMPSTPESNAFTPLENPAELSTRAPAHAAAGTAAVVSSFNHLLSRTGPLRAAAGMLGLNQTDGFDCPSCAWPDPDGHRSAFEFCENGAKALASEITSCRADPAFFAQHSIAELARHSDFQLDQAGRLTHPMVLRPGATHYEVISWEDAFALAAEEFKALPVADKAVNLARLCLVLQMLRQL
jgi:anaerobic selenocysteine-containing dehydrogenase